MDFALDITESIFALIKKKKKFCKDKLCFPHDAIADMKKTSQKRAGF